MARNILAVFLGYLVIAGLVAATDQLAALSIPGFSSMKVPPDWFFAVTLATDTIYTLVGGWVCALVSRYNAKATIGLIVLGEAVGVLSTVLLWTTVPHFYSYFLLLMFPPAVWLGAKFRWQGTPGGSPAAGLKP